MLTRRWAIAAGVLVVAAIAAYFVAERLRAGNLPAGFVQTNGRIEMTQLDIATKNAGRVVEITPQEGALVEAGQVVARLDAAELEAVLRRAQAEVERGRQALADAEALREVRRSERLFAEQELARALILVRQGYATRERLDQRQSQMAVAEAALRSAQASIEAARAAITAAEAEVDRVRTLLADTVVRAPTRGRVQHRLVEPGAVVAAGGRILTILDPADVYMTVFLPAGDAGRLRLGDEARIIVDIARDHVFPASVSFVASEAQFTPRSVETAAERERLMFRVRLRAPAEIVRRYEDQVKSGLRAIAYLRTDQAATWPSSLAVRLPQ